MATSLKQSATLVIDDFQSMRTMLMGFLKSMGVASMDNAGTAKEALALLAARKYDIVICDYNLGHGQNGQQILEEAKYKNYIGYSTIWMMVTAEKTMDMFMGAAETKPDDYLLKPITESLLETRLNKLIEKKLSLEPIEKAVKAKDYIRAIALCDEQIKTRPTSTQELQRIKSDLLITIGDFPAAKAYFESILAVRSTPWAKTALGKVHFMSKDYFRAKELFQEVLDENKMYLEAADWLAKTLDALGDLKEAQLVLSNAMFLSPNATARQKSLADAAYKNGALDLAQSAYEKAIKLSEHSVHKSANTYAGLAKVLTAKDDPAEALKVLDRSRDEFRDDPEAALQTAVLEGMAYQKMGQPEKAVAALALAEELMRDQPGNVSATTAMDMANALLKLGQKNKACGLLESVVKNNHENAGIIHMVEAVFEDAGMGSEGDELIKKSAQEVIAINNQGVILANEGKFEEGIKLMRQALKNLPNNDLMIANLCGMMIGLMSRDGKDDRLIFEAREHLDRVRKINPGNKKYNVYVNILNKLASAPA
ncbi:MAG: tetratricopeptide repeat protein [Gallionellaceae bacterium]|nr:MAG: tetratricopeptide repeat protein [Gallionellaceae bacterium]